MGPIDDEELIVEQHIDDNDDDESDDVSDAVGDESDDVSERWKGYFIGPNGFRQTRTGEVAAQEQPQTQPLKKVNDDYFADQAEVVNEPPAPSVEAASLATMEETPLGGATEAAVEAESSTDAMPTSIGRSRVGEETTSAAAAAAFEEKAEPTMSAATETALTPEASDVPKELSPSSVSSAESLSKPQKEEQNQKQRLRKK